MEAERVFFHCDDIELEGELQLPDRQRRYPVFVVCHPHPLYGGDMDNNLVLMICDALIKNSVAALRFNFRGVGGSGGNFGGGIKEREDIKAALDYLRTRTEIDPAQIGLAGYSFGGSVAFPVANEDKRIKKLVLISPALPEKDWQDLKNYTNSKLVVIGDTDSVVSFPRLRKYFLEDNDFQIVAGADHFWWGHEAELEAKLTPFLRTSKN